MANINRTTPQKHDNPIAVTQPDLLVQFIGTMLDFDPTTRNVTFRLPELAPSQAEAMARFADRLILDKTPILVLTYDAEDFQEYNQRVNVRLKAQHSGDTP